jgi:pyruvate, orthophosphate dikinase
MHNEDVVAGIRTPKKITEMEKDFPKCYKELVDIYTKLELHYHDMQDIEFTFWEIKKMILGISRIFLKIFFFH